MMACDRTELGQDWRLFILDDAEVPGEISSGKDYPDKSIPAQVPGDYALDFVREGLWDDPYYQDQYLKLREYENHHIFYSLRFRYDRQPDSLTSILFEGIDTVADVYLNGVKIGHAENMLIEHEFRAPSLEQGENELFVHIYPCVLEARKHAISPYEYAHKYGYETLVIRKAAHMFGWDICPRIVSGGLWRPVSIVQRKPEAIRDVVLWVDRLSGQESAKCTLAFDVELGRSAVIPYSLRVEGQCGDSRFCVEDHLWFTHGRMSFSLDKPRLWWPRGYGEAQQYDVTATLLKDGQPVDTLCWKQGLRTVQLHRDDCLNENQEGDFCFLVNNRRIYVQGTNWVPADAFHSNDPERIPQILDLVKDIGCNALRVWGGGVYESDAFYDWCDANGIMIWQDFMMACGIYPHTQRMEKQLREEATAVVRRLRHHASICLWAGDNECDQNYCWFDMPQDPTNNRLTRQIIPDVLHSEDLSRPYLPSSPYVSREAFLQGRQQDTPEQHLWGPRDYFKGAFYHDATAVFASEMGYHGCNSPASLYRFIGREQAWPVDDNPLYLYHAASPELENSPYTYRIRLMSSQLAFLFGVKPDHLDEYARMSQISQAEAMKFFVECFRSRKGKRTGLIWWNIMDCWPQISDAVVDYYFCKKLAYHFIKRSQQPVCLMMDDHGGELKLYGVSNLLAEQRVSYRLFNVTSGQTLAHGDATLPADAAIALETVDTSVSPLFYGIEWTTSSGETGSNHYLHGKPPYDYAWYLSNLHAMGFDEFEGFEG